MSENFTSKIVEASELNSFTSCRLGKITQVLRRNIQDVFSFFFSFILVIPWYFPHFILLLFMLLFFYDFDRPDLFSFSSLLDVHFYYMYLSFIFSIPFIFLFHHFTTLSSPYSHIFLIFSLFSHVTYKTPFFYFFFTFSVL